ncbi:hypothetical protein BCR44DRAFT_54776 [Catenaria anguillulae PL171]|uniref:Uncharacterized protein n=1 Tax=Catenaria anguillulae PL171 TaxID=765915 RepID=A0A1Y2H857_9FUNG|nr:hypothetical protein BCR44DRAFT_54776 [Catenaria anguillulae PL171]
MNALLALLVLVTLAGTPALAQKTPSSTGAVFECARLQPAQDPTCSLFSPLDSALPAGKSEDYIRRMKLTAALCPSPPPAHVGLFVCFTPLGNCNGLAWPLPKDENDLKGAVEFYNNVTLADLIPVAKSKSADSKLLCYKECKDVMDWMGSCPGVFGGLRKDRDACAGLPTTNCINAEALKATAPTAAATTSEAAPAPTTTKPAGSGAMGAVGVGKAAVVAVGAAGVLALAAV